ncbi:hypothetical protein AC578_193 [Pseudocercospora eumusae]|uniref:Uncharacterized protein n=1 Tax=Pseudocercospora eumusae TaxID=321146 RepID=A0A139HIJ9_9PEZI|nr:hypothetical protein AC578_193 [Pseudocercospora eumusae]
MRSRPWQARVNVLHIAPTQQWWISAAKVTHTHSLMLELLDFLLPFAYHVFTAYPRWRMYSVRFVTQMELNASDDFPGVENWSADFQA